jgi:hypothetical protein
MKTNILKNNELKAVSIGLGLSALYLILAIVIGDHSIGSHNKWQEEGKYLRSASKVFQAVGSEMKKKQ